MRKIKKNDDVIVIAGKDKGNRGNVLRVLGEYLLVGGINKVKKHQKPNPVKGLTGESWKKNCQFTFRMWRFLTRLPKKAIESVLKRWKMDARFVCSGPTAK